MLLLAALACAPPLCAETGNRVEDCAPPLSLDGADGLRWELEAHLGDVVLVEFIALWCGICVEMAPRGQALYASRADQGLEVATVVIQNLEGDNADQDAALQWAEAFDLTHAVLYDPEYVAWNDWSFMDAVPLSFVVDREGTIRARGAGGVSEDTLGGWIDAWL